MTENDYRWTVGGGATVLVLVSVLMLREFSVSGQTAWNVFLVVFLVGLAIASFLLNRYFASNPDEIGEARFDTFNKSDLDG
jgi:ABC-type glycerol-3-phosphate transport system permease component